MSPEDEKPDKKSKKKLRKQQQVRIVREKSKRRQYVSTHFPTPASTITKTLPISKKRVVDHKVEQNEAISNVSKIAETTLNHTVHHKASESEVVLPRIFFGLNVDELSSDSDLTDVPDDLGINPFFSDEDRAPPTVFRALGEGRQGASKHKPGSTKTSTTATKRSPTISPYFPSIRHAHRPQFLATLPFPPLSHPEFGLMQEKLAHDPFRLLLATIFLNKTPGIRAMPIFYDLMDRYPTPKLLAQANVADVTAIIHKLGFQNQRARKCVELAKVWVEAPPVRGKRYRKLHYPAKGDGRDIKEDEVLDDGDDRIAWEISHLPGLGPYSHDSWRMFCRDKLRGVAKSWLGGGAADSHFEQEWKRVLPTDKELRAWMTWMWLKEGWVWNKENGSREKASEELMKLASGGGVVQEEAHKNHLTVKGSEHLDSSDTAKVEQPAGDFMPQRS